MVNSREPFKHIKRTIEMMRKINKIVIHCSATRSSMDVGVKEIRSWHVDGRGWRDIGYHVVVRRNGSIEIGRPLEISGAHAKGFNKDSIGVCWVGGVNDQIKPENNMTSKQEQALWGVVKGFMEKFDLGKEDVVGHRDLPDVNKACPSFDVKEWLDKKQWFNGKDQEHKTGTLVKRKSTKHTKRRR